MVKNIANELASLVEESAKKLKTLDTDSVSKKPAPNKWSVKEILGHLVDSAVNNHNRFVRAQEVDFLESPGYHQDFWVSVQSYNTAPWTELVELWKLYNLLLAHIISHVMQDKLNVKCKIGNNEPVTLEFLIEDYVAHMKHHLKQIEDRIAND